MSSRASPRGADPSRAHVLVAVRARPELRARVVEVDQCEPPEARPGVELLQHRVHARRRRRSRSRRPTGAPCRGRSRTVRARSQLRPARRRCGPSSSIGTPSPKPTPDPFSSTSLTPWRIGVHRVERRRGAPREARDAGRRRPRPRCEPTWTLTYVAPRRGRHAQLVRQDRHGSRMELRLRARRD